MKTGFKDPIEVKTDKKMKSPWDFTAPEYDERSSCYVNAGCHYGVGHKQPVGRKDNPKATSPVLPKLFTGIFLIDKESIVTAVKM